MEGVMERRTNLVLLFVLSLVSSGVLAQEAINHSARLVDPFNSFEEAEEALRTAEIVDSKDLGTGITNPIKLYLQKDTLKFKAVFKSVNERRFGITTLQKGTEVDFKDSWMYEVVAYELDKLLGLNMVPPTVERVFKGKKGSVQLWVENAMTEKDRKLKNLEPPDTGEWNRQLFQVRLFDNLIYNIDRNVGNLLITPDWRIHMIDHSRCFKNLNMIKTSDGIKMFAKSTMQALDTLDEAKVKTCCSRYLSSVEIKTLLKRREILMHQYQTLLAEKGDVIHFAWN
jgi:hypothetical protein